MAERLILALMVICTAAVARVTGDCGPPRQLENGSPTDEFISGKSFPVGTRLRYKCYAGYTFKQGSSMFVTCSQDSEWTPLKAICEPNNCGNPGELLNGYYEAAATTFGNKAIFVCNPGYHLVGRSYRLCKADGWDGQVPTCETVKCDDPPPIDNGRVSTRTSNWEYGMEAEYSCIDNYSLIGKGSITCTVTGQWDMSPPTCKVVECRRPELSAHIRITSGFGPTYKYKNSIIYRCDAGYEMVGSSVIECSEDNTFVPPPPTCKLAATTTAVTATTTGAAATTPVTATTTAATTPTNVPPPNRTGMIIGIIIAVVVVVVIIIVVICYFKKGRKGGQYVTSEKVTMNPQFEQVQERPNCDETSNCLA